MSAQPDQRPQPKQPRRRFQRYHDLLSPAPVEQSIGEPSTSAIAYRPVGLPRVLASVAFMFGPALSAHLLLTQFLPKASVDAEPALAELVRGQQRLSSWISAADLGGSSNRLRAELESIGVELDGAPASQCALPLRQELKDLQRRLSQDFSAGLRLEGRPSWQQRYGQQIASAEENIGLCQNG